MIVFLLREQQRTQGKEPQSSVEDSSFCRLSMHKGRFADRPPTDVRMAFCQIVIGLNGNAIGHNQWKCHWSQQTEMPLVTTNGNAIDLNGKAIRLSMCLSILCCSRMCSVCARYDCSFSFSLLPLVLRGEPSKTVTFPSLPRIKIMLQAL